MGHGSVSRFIEGPKEKYSHTSRKDGRECRASTQFCIRTVLLVEEYVRGGVGIPEGRDLRCGGSDKNIWCCTRIQRRDGRGDRQSSIDGGQDSELQEAEGSVADVGVNRRGG